MNRGTLRAASDPFRRHFLGDSLSAMSVPVLLGFPDILTELVAVIIVAAALGFIVARLGQPVILAFIAAGIIVGPSGLGWVRSADEIHLLAEMGLAILLFVVGLRLDLYLMRSIGSVAAAIGLCQVLVTGAGGFALARALGATGLSSIYLALALAFSSTVVAVKLLSDKRDLDSLYGRISLGILIVQDLLVVLALTILPALEAGGTGNTALAPFAALGKGALILLVTGVLGLLVLPRFIDKVAKSSELLLLFATSWALAIAAFSGLLGFSKEVGAFLAGMALASTPHKDVLAAKLVSLRDFLLLFFFLELGSRLDLSAVSARASAAVALSAFVLLGKPVVIMSIMGVMGYRKRTGFFTGITLAQTSEFSLILAAAGFGIGHIGQETLGLITVTAAVTIGMSATLVGSLGTVYQKLSPVLKWFERKATYREQVDDTGRPPDVEVIVFGLGRYGSIIARELIARGRRLLGVDFDPQAVKASNACGIPAVFGDAEDPEYLSSLPLDSAKWVLCSVRDPNVTRLLAAGLKRHNYRGIVALTADDPLHAADLSRAGADLIFEPFEDSAVQAVDRMQEAEAQIRRRNMDKMIEQTSNHFIICGYGRMGQQIVKDLQRENVPLVVVESNPEQLPKLVESNIPHVVGNASEDATLLKAGVERARGLVSVLPTDEDNVFVVLTARVLNPSLYIVARSIREENEDKLRRAGADKVMSPYILGGRQIAAAVTKPEVMEFLELVLHSDHFDTNVAHIVVSENSPHVGQSLAELGLWQNCGVTVLAVRRNDTIHANPCPSYTVQPGDEVICIGSQAQIDAAQAFLAG